MDAEQTVNLLPYGWEGSIPSRSTSLVNRYYAGVVYGLCPTLPMLRSGFESHRPLQFRMSMKIHEAKGVEQLDEITFKQAVAAAGVGASLMGAPHKAEAPVPHAPMIQTMQQQAKPVEQPKLQLSQSEQKAVDQITQRYNADPDFVAQVIQLVKKYQKPGFPTARDLMAIIAVESEFDPDAVSGLSHDPAVGLMQVRPNVWGIDPEELKDPETAIKIGADILHKYYRHLHGDKEAALQAYNVGLTNYQQGEENPRYVQKYLKRMKNISPIT